MKNTAVLLLFGLLWCSTFAEAIGLDFVLSDFSSGTEGWEPNMPWTVETTNGLEEGNPYLFMPVDGEGVGGKMITFNSSPDWTGDYIASGVTGITLDIVNWSESDTVYLRVVLGNRANPQQGGGTWLINTNPVVVPADGEWKHVFLPLLESEMIRVGNLSGELGEDSFATVLSDVQTIRVLSAIIPLGAIGDEFIGDVGMDNIVLVPEPSKFAFFLSGLALVFVLKKRKSLRSISRILL